MLNVFLKQSLVNQEEEQLYSKINKLPESDRKQFYNQVKHKIKDPDTYAALNWLFIAGLHHFYLGKWIHGCLNLLIFILGGILIISDFTYKGIFLIVLISCIELYALFRSQIIIQDFNNKVYQKVLQNIKTVNTK